MTATEPSAEAMAESRKFCPIGSAESEVMSLAYLLDAFAAEAVKAEREACAKLADNSHWIAYEIADEIRARGAK